MLACGVKGIVVGTQTGECIWYVDMRWKKFVQVELEGIYQSEGVFSEESWGSFKETINQQSFYRQCTLFSRLQNFSVDYTTWYLDSCVPRCVPQNGWGLISDRNLHLPTRFSQHTKIWVTSSMVWRSDWSWDEKSRASPFLKYCADGRVALWNIRIWCLRLHLWSGISESCGIIFVIFIT